MEFVFGWVIMLLCLFGLVQLGELICVWFRRPQEHPSIFSVMTLSGDIDNIEETLRYFEETSRWSPDCRLAFVVDMGLSEKSADECLRWCSSKSRLIFCGKKELAEICKGTQDKVY